MDDFDLTQPMSLCCDDDDTMQETDEAAVLKIPVQDGIPNELEFLLFNGLNKIGRSESCEVCINNKVLSKEHAVIEVGGDCYLIYDLNSSNKTWRGKKPLKPNVKYKLDSDEDIRFGNIKAQFIVRKREVNDGGDSGSETGSESMLLLNEEYPAFTVSTPVKNASVNEEGNEPLGNASTSDTLFSKNVSAVEAEEVHKEASPDLENAPTQVFNGMSIPDSDDETDCEDHPEEKTVSKEINSDGVTVTPCIDKAVNKQTSANKTCVTEVADYVGVSSLSSRSLKKPSDPVNSDENRVNNMFPEEKTFNKDKLPRSCSLESNEDLPPTQLNLALHDEIGNSEYLKRADGQNIAHVCKSSEPFDSLPATQLNTRNYDANFEISESQRTKTNVSLHSMQHKSGHFGSDINNFDNNVLKQKNVISDSDDDTKDSDDLPPTQPNLALQNFAIQHSEEQNFLQHGVSQCSYNKNPLSPKASTSGVNYSRTSAVASSSFHAASNHKKSNIPSEKTPEMAGKESFTTNKSSRVSFLTSINISVDEGSTVEENSIICPSTQRRSDVSDLKIRNTEVNCSPSLSIASVEQGKESIAETPPHLLKESTLADSNSYTSRPLSGISPIALRISDSMGDSYCEHKTSDNRHTPSTSGKPEMKIPTPDSAKAGDLNYSINCSPKVYKTKLNDLDKSSQEDLNFDKNASKAANSSQLKCPSKEFTSVEPHGNEPGAAKELIKIPQNQDASENSDDGSDLEIGRGRRSKKQKAAKKRSHETKVKRSAAAKRTSPDSCTNSTVKKSKIEETLVESKMPNLSLAECSHISYDHEDDSQSKLPPKQRSKRCHVSLEKYITLESNVSKRLHLESGSNDDNEEERFITASHEEQLILENSVPPNNTGNVKSNARKKITKEKESKSDKNIPLQPTRKSRRQRSILNKSSENCEKQVAYTHDISSNIMKGGSGSDSKDDLASVPRRKTAKNKLLQSELNHNAPRESKQGVSFCAFQKSEAVEVEVNNLTDSRSLRRRKAVSSKDVAHEEGFSPFKGQANEVTNLELNESEISVSSTGEQSNIALRRDQSNTAEDLESVTSSKKITRGDESSSRKKTRAGVVTKLSVPVERLPLTPRHPSRMKHKIPIENEMQIDSLNETRKSNGQSFNTVEEVEDNLSKNRSRPAKKQISQLRRSSRKGMPPNDSTDESHISEVLLDSNAKPDKDNTLIELKKGAIEKKRAPGSRRLPKKEEMYNPDPAQDSLSSAVSLDSTTRSLRLRLSTSETSADQKPGASGKCQISVFAKDSVKSLIKLDVTNLVSTQNKTLKDVQSKSSRKSRVSKKEVNETAVGEMKNNEQSDQKSDSSSSSSPPPGTKKGKRHHDLNSSSVSVSNSISEKDVTPSKSKRAKNKNVTFSSPSSRQQNQIPKPKVMFTMVEDEEPQKVVVDLGGKVVEDVNLCTHLVADKLRRTVKSLCCIAKGIPLVNTKWLQECKKLNSFVGHVPYLIKDNAAEKQYKFELQKTLQKSAEKPLLSSWSVHVTPKVLPSPEQMKDIIQCAGGKYLPKMPNRLSEKTVVVACASDLNLCSHAVKCGIPVVGSEFILTGLLQYKTDTKSYMLSKN